MSRKHRDRNPQPRHEVEITLLIDGKPWKTHYFKALTLEDVKEWEHEFDRIGWEYEVRIGAQL